MKRLTWIAVSLVLASAWAFTLRPTSLRGPAGYVMVRGVSMLPTYVGGDLIVTHKAKSYSKGDIVAYKVPKGDFGAGILVIHRIIGGNAKDGFIIKGDNNNFRDDWQPKPKDILGKAWLRLPHMGVILAFLHSPLPMASLGAAFVIVFVLFPEDKKKARTKKLRPPVAEARVETELPRDDHALDLTGPLADL